VEEVVEVIPTFLRELAKRKPSGNTGRPLPRYPDIARAREGARSEVEMSGFLRRLNRKVRGAGKPKDGA
jgi:hypothetical protein